MGAANPTPSPIPADVAEAVARLAGPTAACAELLALAEVCRRAGALQSACDLVDLAESRFGRVPATAAPLRRAFDGALDVRCDPVAGPVPIVRRTRFLSDSHRAEIFSGLQASIACFEPSPLSDGEREYYADDRRTSLTWREIGAIGETLRGALTPLLREKAPETLALLDNGGAAIDMHAQIHGDGDFFGPHCDLKADAAHERLLSFVYYMHSQPRRFTGGDLLIYDRCDNADVYNPAAYTRIIPDENSIVVFPGFAVHEVDRVALPSRERMDARFTITGSVVMRAP